MIFHTGTKVGDPVECKTIDNIFCINRKNPLLVGSIKSNIGHTELASGVCGIIKSIFAFESGSIAPNIHFTKARPELEALEAGRIQVVTDIQRLEGSLIAVNSFGIGGANGKIFVQ